jgi:hypothetical protein
MPDRRLVQLAQLERRYDGPVPEPERLLADFGSVGKVQLLVAAGNSAFYRGMVRQQIATIRRRRAAATAYPELLADLRLYRDRWRYWRRKHALAAALMADCPRGTALSAPRGSSPAPAGYGGGTAPDSRSSENARAFP